MSLVLLKLILVLFFIFQLSSNFSFDFVHEKIAHVNKVKDLDKNYVNKWNKNLS